MSNIFLKSNFADLLNTTTEEDIKLPTHINIMDAYSATSDMVGGNYSATSSMIGGNGNYSATSSMIGGNGNYSATSAFSSKNFNSKKSINKNNYSATSSAMIGGNYSATSAMENNNEINKLISMLTSESSATMQGLSETSTISLEQQLRDILKKDNGKQKGGNKNDTLNLNMIHNVFTEDGFSTTTDINNTSATSPVNSDLLNMTGGKKKSYTGNDDNKSKKPMNPGFAAFLDLKKLVAKELSVSNGPIAGKVAGAVQREVKEKYPNLDSIEIAKKAIEHFKANIKHFKQML